MSETPPDLDAVREQRKQEELQLLALPSWDAYFIRMAMLVSEKSKDTSTKVGCVLVGPHDQVLSTGFNGFPRGVAETVTEYETSPGAFHSWKRTFLHPDRWTRPVKYEFAEHAERNAIYNAARHGVKLDGARAYLNWEACPCTDCARAFIQAGIVEVVGPNIPFPGAGTGTHYQVGSTSLIMLKEAGVKVRSVGWGE